MNATVALSYQLLVPHEQRSFRRLGVLPGPFSIEAVAAVLSDDAATPAPLDEAQRAAAGPIERSLLIRAPSPVGSRPLFVMLETVRAYALAALTASGDHGVAMEGLALGVGDLPTAHARFTSMTEGSEALGVVDWLAGHALGGRASAVLAARDLDATDRFVARASALLTWAGPWCSLILLYVLAVLAVRHREPDHAIAYVRSQRKEKRECVVDGVNANKAPRGRRGTEGKGRVGGQNFRHARRRDRTDGLHRRWTIRCEVSGNESSRTPPSA